MGGGYNSVACIKSYYNVLSGLLLKQEYLEEEEIPDSDPGAVRNVISQLKQTLREFWSL